MAGFPSAVLMQEERSQGRNRERAMALLRAKLFELELEKQRRCSVELQLWTSGMLLPQPCQPTLEPHSCGVPSAFC